MVNRKKIGDKNNSNIQALTRRGPPNRMNDLAYRDWMKFQKSFFWYVSAQVLIEECIYFFTKAIWPDGNPSRSLVVGFHDFEASAIPTPRLVDAYDDSKSMADMVDLLNNLAKSGNKYDFVLLDLRYHIKDTQSLSSFLTKYSNGLFKALRSLLLSKRYCGLLVSMEENGGTGFPFPWAVALSCRNYLRLRDEKVALNKEKDRVFYCLFMQADEDNRPPYVFTPESIRVSKTRQNIPAWTIPKPPPRKKGELLHPAKYPETLVEEFIQLFTQPGDNVFDPMVGTGSTVLAAVRTKRNGYGVDLIPKFVDIAQRRIAYETEPMLFHEMSPSKSLIIQGDATRLEQIPELSGVKFNYAITSPPYWSMLRNPGSEYQESRRKKNLPLFYSQHERDLGNV
ncbi:MAG: DNA methyltransferase, partial [Candidatus Hodarchaeota archaeon]